MLKIKSYFNHFVLLLAARVLQRRQSHSNNNMVFQSLFNKKVFVVLALFLFYVSSGQSPIFMWAKSFGSSDSSKFTGNYNDWASGITTDPFGNIYTTGELEGIADFDPGPGVYTLTTASPGQDDDVFISKLDAFGNFVWAKQFGGASFESGYDIVYGNNAIYISGFFFGVTDFDPGPGVFTLTNTAGPSDFFICKLDLSGNFIWAVQTLSSQQHEITDMEVDAFGNVYVTGNFEGSIDFDPGPGNFFLTSSGFGDAFIWKLDANGNFVWAKSIGSSSTEWGRSVAVDGIGNVFVAGTFNGTVDFDPGPGVLNLTSPSFWGGYYLKLDASGNFIWAKNVQCVPWDIGLDASGNIYSTGYFGSPNDFDPGVGTYTLANWAANDIFISKFDTAGNFGWAKAVGGYSFDFARDLALDNSSNVYITGPFQSTVDFDPGPGIDTLTSNGNYDAYVLKLDPLGNYVWAVNMGGSIIDWSETIAVDVSGNVITAGHFESSGDYDPGSGVYTLTSVGQIDIYIHKFGQGPTGINEKSEQTFFSLYPNPNVGIFNLSINKEMKKGELILLNNLCQEVYSQKITKGINSINCKGFAQGLYHVLISDNDQIIGSNKIMID